MIDTFPPDRGMLRRSRCVQIFLLTRNISYEITLEVCMTNVRARRYRIPEIINLNLNLYTTRTFEQAPPYPPQIPTQTRYASMLSLSQTSSASIAVDLTNRQPRAVGRKPPLDSIRPQLTNPERLAVGVEGVVVHAELFLFVVDHDWPPHEQPVPLALSPHV